MALEKEIELLSLCVVSRDKGERPWLFRLADIIDGEVVPFEVDDALPKYFGNRTRLFSKGETHEDGFAGVWSWSAIPNLSGAEKDYVESNFVPNLEPVEIIRMQGSWTAKKLGEALRTGVKELPSATKVLYCFSIPGERELLGGLLCTQKELEVENGVAKLKAGISSLDYFVLRERNCLTLRSTEPVPWKDFYRFLNLGKISKKVFVMTPPEIVKSVLTRTMTWQISKPHMTKNEWKMFREFLQKMEDVDLVEEVAGQCECTPEEAKEHIEAFLSQAGRYLEAADVQEQSLLTAMEQNPEIWTKCEDSLAVRWKKEHREEVEKAEKELEKLREELESTEGQLEEKFGDKKRQLTELEATLEGKQKELTEVEAALDRARTLGNQVQKKVEDQLLSAREDASSLISSLLMSWPVQKLGLGAGSDPQMEARADRGRTGQPCFAPGRYLVQDRLKGYESWRDLMGVIMDELYRAGVAEGFETSLAAFLMTAWQAGAPVLLAGPGGEAIADAFSAAVTGRMAGVLDCSGEYSREGVEEIFSHGDQVVLVKRPFATDWNDALSSLLLPPRCFFILATPFAEDLRLEPAGWKNYVLPVLTEVFLDDLPSLDYVGGTMLPGYEPYQLVWEEEENPLYEKIRLGNLARNRMKMVVGNTRLIVGDEGNESLYLYGLLPQAYLRGECGEFSDLLQEETSLAPVVLERIRTFLRNL